MNDANKTLGGLIVHKFGIIGTRCTVYAVYEKTAGYFGPHSSLLTIEGVLCGQTTSRRLPEEVDAIPVGPARWEALDAWRAANEAEAYAAIVAAFPEAAEGTRRSGEIEVWS